MMLHIDFWEFLGLLIGVAGAFVGLCKVLFAQAKRYLDTRFSHQDITREANYKQVTDWLRSIEQVHRTEATQWQRVEREVLQLKADLPLHYVRREDYIRGQSVLEAKLDGLASKVDNAQLRAVIQQQGAPTP